MKIAVFWVGAVWLWYGPTFRIHGEFILSQKTAFFTGAAVKPPYLADSQSAFSHIVIQLILCNLGSS
jgi:hypothetical protein